MKNKTLLVVSLLIAAGTAQAESSLLQQAGTQAVKDAAKSAVPATAADQAQTTGDAVDKAQTTKSAAETTPDTLNTNVQDTATEPVKQKVDSTVPESVKHAPISTHEVSKAVKSKVKQQATEKALDLVK
ncbi:MAG: hypothetical protein ABL925_09450 [Methylococcales bacterium]